MTAFDPCASVRRQAVALLRAEERWVPATWLKHVLGVASVTNALRPAIRAGELETVTVEGLAYYRFRPRRVAPVAEPVEAQRPRRFQLVPVWPPGFVPRFDEALPCRPGGA